MNRFAISIALAAAAGLTQSHAFAAGTTIKQGVYRGVAAVERFDVSPPLRSMLPLAPDSAVAVRAPEDLSSGLEGPLGPRTPDTVVQTAIGAGEMPAPSVSFDGPSNISNVAPPDPVGDVGPNHYVAMSNLSFQIFAKTGASLYGPAANNTLWAGFGGACQTENAGDPIVLHDPLADRWLMSQFTAAGPNWYLCIAVSVTADPTGPWYRYAVSTGGNFPDYPKYGVGADAYYVATREFVGGNAFAGIGAYALSRAQFLAGNSQPTVISFLVPPGGTPYLTGDGLQPASLDGVALPPTGSPHFYVGTMDDGGPYGAPQDALTLWKFHADFNAPANSSFALASTIPVAPFDSMFPCTPSARNCIPQPGTANKLDILSYRQRPMHRVAWRNFGDHESLVTNQSVEASPGIAGIRWYELRDPNGAPYLHQQGTYAPGTSDGVHRWMGSVAMDANGNMALGYSASNGTTTFPSVFYTGRLATDPVGQMPQGESSIINGSGAQTATQRWGDYTSMNVDPADDCTFWYVNEYLPATSSAGWRLRIGAFRFPSCTAPSLAQRAWVSAAGNDGNGCTLLAPCRTLDRAIARTATGGEVVVLDTAGYGPATIARPVSIVASPGAHAGINVSSGAGIVVNAAHGTVTIRGLTLNALGGAIGIDFQSGDALFVEDVSITNFAVAGINATTSAAAVLALRDVKLRDNAVGVALRPAAGGTGALTFDLERANLENNATGLSLSGRNAKGVVRGSLISGGNAGIVVQPTVSGATSAIEVRRSTVTKSASAAVQATAPSGSTAAVTLVGAQVTDSGTGVLVQAGGAAYVSDSTVTKNAMGISASGGGTALSLGDNRLLNNTTNGAFTSTVGKQ